jgi:hypothetical protein
MPPEKGRRLRKFALLANVLSLIGDGRREATSKLDQKQQAVAKRMNSHLKGTTVLG